MRQGSVPPSNPWVRSEGRSGADARTGSNPADPPPVASEVLDPPEPKDADGQSEFPCGQCGAVLTYAPGTRSISCQYCGHANDIPEPPKFVVEEQDFEYALADMQKAAPAKEVDSVKCDGCSAAFRWTKDTHAHECPFCGAPIVVDPKKARPIQPTAVVPFQLTEADARGRLKKWLGSLWFAPGDVRRLAYAEGRLTGVYLPYWTYDANTDSDYSGQRGDLHMETYQDVDAQGRTVTRTRTYVVWTPVSGRVQRFFDDVLVLASPTLPEKFTRRLKTWDLTSLVPYQDQFLSGYRSELYQVDLPNGYAQAKAYMERVIYHDVCLDIGGHQQQVHHINSRFSDITFKHVLLPIWSNAYRYRGRRYHFLVNGQTGEVQGERPWSWIRITLAVIAGALLVGGLIWALAAAETFQ